MWLLNNFYFATLFPKISPSPLSSGERTDDQECKEAQKIIYVKKISLLHSSSHSLQHHCLLQYWE